MLQCTDLSSLIIYHLSDTKQVCHLQGEKLGNMQVQPRQTDRPQDRHTRGRRQERWGNSTLINYIFMLSCGDHYTNLATPLLQFLPALVYLLAVHSTCKREREREREVHGAVIQCLPDSSSCHSLHAVTPGSTISPNCSRLQRSAAGWDGVTPWRLARCLIKLPRQTSSRGLEFHGEGRIVKRSRRQSLKLKLTKYPLPFENHPN